MSDVLRIWFARFRTVCGLCYETVEENARCVYIDNEVCHVQCAEDEGYEVAT